MVLWSPNAWTLVVCAKQANFASLLYISPIYLLHSFLFHSWSLSPSSVMHPSLLSSLSSLPLLPLSSLSSLPLLPLFSSSPLSLLFLSSLSPLPLSSLSSLSLLSLFSSSPPSHFRECKAGIHIRAAGQPGERCRVGTDSHQQASARKHCRCRYVHHRALSII